MLEMQYIYSNQNKSRPVTSSQSKASNVFYAKTA